MVSKGRLDIRWDGAAKIQWTWTPAKGQQRVYVRELQEKLGDVLRRYWKVWDAECLRIHGDGRAAGARTAFDEARQALTGSLFPPDFDLTTIPRGLICVSLYPQSVPVEALDVDGLPFGVRNILLHCRPEAATAPPGLPPANHEHCSRMDVASDPKQRPIKSDSRHDEHWDAVCTFLESFYGQANTFRDRLRPLTGQHLMGHLCEDDMSLLYYFGHGTGDGQGALTPDEGQVTAEALAVRYQGRVLPNAGLAFLNACWSSGTCEPVMNDITSTLLRHGWQAVIGMTGRLPSGQAADFAERFFRVLQRRMHIFRSFHWATRRSWRAYHRGGADVGGLPELAWSAYRLHGFPEQPWLHTILTRAGDDPVMQQGTSPIRIADALRAFWEQDGMWTTDQWLAFLLNPDTRKMVSRVLAGDSDTPTCKPLRNICDDETRKVIEDAFRLARETNDGLVDADCFFRKQVKYLREYSEGQRPPLGQDEITLTRSPDTLAPDVREMICEALRDLANKRRLTIDDLATRLQRIKPIRLQILFDPDTGLLRWEQLNSTAKVLLQLVATIAGNDPQILPKHLLEGAMCFAMMLGDHTARPPRDLKVIQYLTRTFRNVETFAKLRVPPLTQDRFSPTSVAILWECLVERGKGRRREGDSASDHDWGFAIELLDSLYHLREEQARPPSPANSDPDLINEMHPAVQFACRFHAMQRQIPWKLHGIATLPAQSPGLSTTEHRVQEEFANVLRAVNGAFDNPHEVPVITQGEYWVASTILAEHRKQVTRQDERKRVVWVPWEGYADAHGVRALVRCVERIRNVLGQGTGVAAWAREELVDDHGMMLCLSIDDPQDLTGPRRDELLRLLKIVTAPEVRAVVMASEPVIEKIPALKKPPFRHVPIPPFSDRTCKALLRAHLKHWADEQDRPVTDPNCPAEDEALEALLKMARERWPGDKLFDRVARLAWNALVWAPDDDDGDRAFSWERIRQAVERQWASMPIIAAIPPR